MHSFRASTAVAAIVFYLKKLTVDIAATVVTNGGVDHRRDIVIRVVVCRVMCGMSC